MSLVTNLGAGEEAGREELSGPTDPVRVVMSHTINPSARAISFTVELLNRMTADVKSLVLRSGSGLDLTTEQAISTLLTFFSSCQLAICADKAHLLRAVLCAFSYTMLLHD